MKNNGIFSLMIESLNNIIKYFINIKKFRKFIIFKIYLSHSYINILIYYAIINN